MTSTTGREVQTIASGGIGAACLVLGLLASGSAEAFACSPSGGSIYPNSGTCAEVSASVGNRYDGYAGDPIPPNYGYTPTVGSTAVIAGGFGGEAVATASTGPGLLRVYARATQGSADDGAYANASATAAMAEGGIIDSPGGTLGDPVHAIVTLEVDGTLFGQAFLNDSFFGFSSRHEGNLENNFAVDRPVFPNLPTVYTFATHIGDDAYLSFGFSVQAAASLITGYTFSYADFGNTAHLYIDFQEEGVYFRSDSGHDYSSAAVVPAPPAVWLLGTALAGLGGRRWLRRKVSS